MTDTTISRVQVVCIGEAMALLLASAGTPLAHADRFTASLAGAEANVAVGLARLGHQVQFVGRVGADPLGQQVLRRLRAENVDTFAVSTDPDAPTGVLIRDCHAERPIEVCYYRARSAGSHLNVADIDAAGIQHAKILHLTGITAMLSPTARAACQHAVAAARSAGVTVSFDPNIRYRLGSTQAWIDATTDLLRAADIISIGGDELTALTGSDNPQVLLDGGAQLVVVKAGAAGATAHTPSASYDVPAWPVHAVDPVGAGDAFTVGLLSGWLRQRPLTETLTEAAVIAGLCVAAPGDVTGLPDPDTLQAITGDPSQLPPVRR